MNDDFNSKIDGYLHDVYLAGWNDKLCDNNPTYIPSENQSKLWAKQAIISLIKSDIIGADDPDDYEITPEFFYNGLRAKQRAILDGGKKK